MASAASFGIGPLCQLSCQPSATTRLSRVAMIFSILGIACLKSCLAAAPRAGRRDGFVVALRLARAMGLYLWFGLEPGRKTEPFPSARFYDNKYFMAKSINVIKKSRGRPATGQ